MGAAAIAGAFVTSLSIIGLVMGKNHWFRPGSQVWAAWVFTGLEVLVAMLNVITAILVARHQSLGMLAYWLAYGAPCTVFIPMIGWIMISFLDPSREIRHAEMEMEDDKRRAELDYLKAAHDAQMTVMHDQLEQFTGFLTEYTSSPENRNAARAAAERMGRQALGNVTGLPIAQPGASFIYELPAQAGMPVSHPNEVTGELEAVHAPPPQDDAPSLAALAQTFKRLLGIGGGEPGDENSPLPAPASLSQNGHRATPEELGNRQ